jgi:hypothetical protein
MIRVSMNRMDGDGLRQRLNTLNTPVFPSVWRKQLLDEYGIEVQGVRPAGR